MDHLDWKRGLSLALAYASSATATIALIPILPRIAESYRTVPAAAALVPMVLALPTLMLALSSSPIGWVADRLGARPTLIGGLLLCGLTGIGCYAARDVYVLLAWRAAAGVAMAAIIVAGNTLLARFFQGAEQQRWVGRQMVVFGIVAVIVSLAAGWLGDVHWRWVFLAPCLTFLLVPPCHAWLRGGLSVSHGEHDRAVAAGSFPVGAVLAVCAFSFAFSLLTFLPAYGVGFILAERGFSSPSQAGYASAVLSLVAIAASAGFSAVAKVQLHTKRILSGGLTTLALLSLLLAGRTGVFLSASFCGAAAGFGIPTLFAWLMSVPPPAFLGRAMGMLQTAIYLGQFLALPVGLTLAGFFGGWTAAIAYLAAAAVLLTLVTAFARSRSPVAG